MVVVLVALLQAAEDRHGVLLRRLIDHHFLESALQRLVLLEVFLVLVERRGADGAQLAARQRRLEDVGRIHRTRRLAGAHEGVYFVDEEQDFALRGGHLLHYGLQPLLEFALVFGAGDQRAHVEREDLLRPQVLGHVAVHDAVGDSLGDGRLAHACLAHEDGVVLGAAREDLQYAPDLLVASDHRVEFPRAGHRVEVHGILAERIELLLRSLRIDRRALAEDAYGLQQLLLGRSGALQQFGCRAALGHQTQQQVLRRGVFVVEFPGEIHGPLYGARALLREERLTRPLHAGQRRHGAVRFVAQQTHVHARAPQQKCRERILLADEDRQQMQRLYGLLSVFARERHGTLQCLLCFDRQTVDVHDSGFLFVSVSIFRSCKTPATALRCVILTAPHDVPAPVSAIRMTNHPVRGDRASCAFRPFFGIFGCSAPIENKKFVSLLHYE